MFFAFSVYADNQLHGRVDALAAGEAVRIHRFELPDGHPMAPPHGGRPTDDLELGADDVVRPAKSTGQQNRKQRRAAGFRGPWTNYS